MRAEEPEPVLRDLRCHPQFVVGFECGVGSFEDVDERIPVNKFLSCESPCYLFFSHGWFRRVAEVYVCEFVRQRAAAFYLQEVDFHPDSAGAVRGAANTWGKIKPRQCDARTRPEVTPRVMTFHGTDDSQTHGHDRISRRSCRTREFLRFQDPLIGRTCSREPPHPSLERRSRSSSPGEYAPPSRICRRRGRGRCQHSLRPFPLTLSGREHAETDERTEHGLTGKEDGAQDQKENDDLHGRILFVVAYYGESSPRARRSASDSPVSAASPRISSIGVSSASRCRRRSSSSSSAVSPASKSHSSNHLLAVEVFTPTAAAMSAMLCPASRRRVISSRSRALSSATACRLLGDTGPTPRRYRS